jgi:hypothetical protein
LHCTAELHLSGLIGTASHSDTQKIRIIGFLFENMLRWQFEVEKIILQTAALRTNKTLIRNSLYVFGNWGKILSRKKDVIQFEWGHAAGGAVG